MDITIQYGKGFKNENRIALGFESISRTIYIDKKYGQYHTAVGNRFRQHRTAVAFENICRAVDFENLGST